MSGRIFAQNSYRSEPFITANKCIESSPIGFAVGKKHPREIFKRLLHGARFYQLEADAWKMSVTILSMICGINSPSTSVKRRVES